jgi:hypothetical protein
MDVLSYDTPIPLGGLTVRVHAVIPGAPPAFTVALAVDESQRGIYLHVCPTGENEVRVDVRDVWGWADVAMTVAAWPSLPTTSWTMWPAPIVDQLLTTAIAPDLNDPATYDADPDRPTWREKFAWLALIWAVIGGRD